MSAVRCVARRGDLAALADRRRAARRARDDRRPGGGGGRGRGRVLLAPAASSRSRSLTAPRCSARRPAARPTPEARGARASASRSATATCSAPTFVWVRETEVTSRSTPASAWLLERREYGPLLRPSRSRSRPERRRCRRRPPASWRRSRRRSNGAPGCSTRARARCAPRPTATNRSPAWPRVWPQPSGAARARTSCEAVSSGRARSRQRSRRRCCDASPRSTRSWRPGALVMRTADGGEQAIPLAKIVRVVPANAIGGGRQAAIYARPLVGVPRRRSRASPTPRAASSRRCSAPP